MEVTIVGLPYYGYNKLANTLVEDKVLTLTWDTENTHSKHAVVAYYNTAKIGYITGRESEEVLKVVQYNAAHGNISCARITDVRVSCLKAELIVPAAYTLPANNDYTSAVKLAQQTLADKYAAITESINKEEKTMFEKIVNTNTVMAQSAAFLEAGRIANNTAAKFVASKSPLMVKGYVDTAFGKLLIANAAAVAVEKFRPQDKKLARLANAMITQAYQEVYQIVDVEKMLNEMLDSESVKSAMAKLEVTGSVAE